MVVNKDVIGSEEAAQPLIVGPTTVYVHENVRPYTPPVEEGREDMPVPENMFIYDETVYTKDEYIDYMSHHQQNDRADIDFLMLCSDMAF